MGQQGAHMTQVMRDTHDTHDTREALIAAAIQDQERVARAMQAGGHAAWLDLDLTPSQIKSLMVLADGARPIYALADEVGLHRPATSTLVEQLVRQGLVLRAEDPTDRRRTLVDLTPAGVALSARLRQGGQDNFHALLVRLAPDDLAAVTRAMRALATAAEACSAERAAANRAAPAADDRG